MRAGGLPLDLTESLRLTGAVPDFFIHDLLGLCKGLNLQTVIASISSTYRRVCRHRPALHTPSIVNHWLIFTMITGEKDGPEPVSKSIPGTQARRGTGEERGCVQMSTMHTGARPATPHELLIAG